MKAKCYKTMDKKGGVYIPKFIREAVGIDKHDVVQVTGRGGVIMINKAVVNAENPIELIQADVKKEQEETEKEKEQVRARMRQLLADGNSLDDVLEEALKFIF